MSETARIQFSIKKRNTQLHSREHVSADDLSKAMLEPKKFAAYLGIAKMYEEPDLRALTRSILEKKDLDFKNRGKYFFGALRRLERKQNVRHGNKNNKEIKRKKARKSH